MVHFQHSTFAFNNSQVSQRCQMYSTAWPLAVAFEDTQLVFNETQLTLKYRRHSAAQVFGPRIYKQVHLKITKA